MCFGVFVATVLPLLPSFRFMQLQVIRASASHKTSDERPKSQRFSHQVLTWKPMQVFPHRSSFIPQRCPELITRAVPSCYLLPEHEDVPNPPAGFLSIPFHESLEGVINQLLSSLRRLFTWPTVFEGITCCRTLGQESLSDPGSLCNPGAQFGQLLCRPAIVRSAFFVAPE